MRWPRFAFFCFYSLVLSITAGHAVAHETLTVFAAASLKDALDEIGKSYEQRKGISIVASYAASSALAKQIESGAPADVFISADEEWMDYAATRKLIKPG